MRHLILTVTLATISFSCAMEKQPYQTMLNRIEEKSIGEPSITLINQTGTSLSMEIGDIEKDQIQSRMSVYDKTELTFSPYGKSFCLNKNYIAEGTIINLKTNGQKSWYNLHIGGSSDIKFGDIVQVNYDGQNISIAHNPNVQLKFRRANKTLLKRSKDNLVPRRSSTFS
jgi:hypothetical protein